MEGTTQKLKQKDAVFEAVAAVLTTNNVTVLAGETVKSKLTPEFKKLVRDVVFDSIKNGAVKYTKELDDKKLRNYVASLVGNWLNKDPRYSQAV